MKIDIMTLFPEMCEAVLGESIVGRARKNRLCEVRCHNIRDYTLDKHNRVDDTPYGGGMGMVMQAEPIYRCYRAITAGCAEKPLTIYLSPQGRVFTQQMAVEFSEKDHLVLLCGHYEGVDERVLEEIVDLEVSIGDYVLTGGELPALVLADAVIRLCDGVLSDQSCFEEESHFNGLWNTPSIQGRKLGTIKAYLLSFYQGITPISPSGEQSRAWNAPDLNVPTFMKTTFLKKKSSLRKRDVMTNDVEIIIVNLHKAGFLK